MVGYALIAWLFSVGGIGGYAWYKGYSWGAEVIHDQKAIIARQRSQLLFWHNRDAFRLTQISGLDKQVAALNRRHVQDAQALNQCVAKKSVTKTVAPTTTTPTPKKKRRWFRLVFP